MCLYHDKCALHGTLETSGNIERLCKVQCLSLLNLLSLEAQRVMLRPANVTFEWRDALHSVDTLQPPPKGNCAVQFKEKLPGHS
jgi:hypothetical protein